MSCSTEFPVRIHGETTSWGVTTECDHDVYTTDRRVRVTPEGIWFRATTKAFPGTAFGAGEQSATDCQPGGIVQPPWTQLVCASGLDDPSDQYRTGCRRIAILGCPGKTVPILVSSGVPPRRPEARLDRLANAGYDILTAHRLESSESLPNDG